MLYTQEDIDRVLSVADIVEVIQNYIPLKRSGSNFKALCPFHSEKTPSFMVSKAKQIFHCFGCGIGGNVFTFVMQYEKVNFPEAVKIVADLVNVKIEPKKTFRKYTLDYYGINKIAGEFFRENFLKSEPKIAEFLKKRGISKESADKFFIGYAPDTLDALVNHLLKKGFSKEDIIKSGLGVIKQQYGNKLIDKFRNRLMFPIRNITGKIIGFSGRCLRDDDVPKYLNSPETPVFRKREVLYGIYEAKKSIIEKRLVIIMEGHIDAVISHQYGITFAVALQGTALTKEHLKLLKNYAEDIILCFDGDSAGVEAAKKSLPLFLENEITAYVMSLPEEEDPASLLQHKGLEEFRKIYKKKKLLFDFKLDNIVKNTNMLIPEKKLEVEQKIFEDIRWIRSRALLDEYFKKAAQIIDIDESSLRKDYSVFLKKNHLKRDAKIEHKDIFSSMRGEVELLKLLLNERNYVTKLKRAEFDINLIENDSVKKIYEILLNDNYENINDLLNKLQDDVDAVKIAAMCAASDIKEKKDDYFNDCVNFLKRKGVERKLEKINKEINEKEKKGEDVTELLKEFQQLLLEKSKGV